MRNSALTILNDLRDVAGDSQAGRQARRVDAGHLHERWNLRIPPDHEISERLGGRVQLRADTAAGEPQVRDGHFRE